MKTIDIFGKLVSKLKGGYVASADQVYDETLGKYQSEINQESGETGVDTKINALVEKMPPYVQGYVKSDGWSAYGYDGEYITPITKNQIRVRTLSENFAGGQGMAMWGDYIVRLKNGGSLSIYRTDGESISLVCNTTFPEKASNWHCNSGQFASDAEAGKPLPLLYVSAVLGQLCAVYRLKETNGTFTPELVQTITVNRDSLLPPSYDIQIGDDGYIYAIGQTQPYIGCYKFRKVIPSEGNVILDERDITDYTRLDVGYNYTDRPRQGAKIYNGKMFFFWGSGGSRGAYIVDLKEKKLLNDFDLAGKIPSGEMEDGDFRNGMLYVCYWPSNLLVQIAFT